MNVAPQADHSQHDGSVGASVRPSGTGRASGVPPADGRSARWAQHREQRRAELLRVARRLIHTQGPEVTMEDIAVASGTSKSIVYRYFTDKAQLQRAIGTHILSDMHRRLVEEVTRLEEDSGGEVGADERIRAMIATFVETAESSPGVYRFVTEPSDRLNHFLSSTARLVAASLPREMPDRQLWAAGAVGFVRGAVDRWMTDRSAADAAPTPGQQTPVSTQHAPVSTQRAPASTQHAPISTQQFVDHLVTWLMKGMQ